MISRRRVLNSAAAALGASVISGRVQAASIPEAPISDKPTTQPPLPGRKAAALDSSTQLRLH